MRCASTLVTLLLIAGCTGMEPFEPINHREEGPSGGIFSGPTGSFTLSRDNETLPHPTKPKTEN